MEDDRPKLAELEGLAGLEGLEGFKRLAGLEGLERLEGLEGFEVRILPVTRLLPPAHLFLEDERTSELVSSVNHCLLA